MLIKLLKKLHAFLEHSKEYRARKNVFHSWERNLREEAELGI